MRHRAIVEVAKEAGKKLLTGNFNLINLSMPVKMSEPRSYLQKLTDVWVYPRYPPPIRCTSHILRLVAGVLRNN